MWHGSPTRSPPDPPAARPLRPSSAAPSTPPGTLWNSRAPRAYKRSMIRFSDVRYALRLWRRHPTMVAVAGLSLGLGVGATTTMYSVVNRVAHYELGFADVDRLAVLWSTNAEKGIRAPPPNWEIIRALLEHRQSSEGFGFFQAGGP